jgi:uncharacterized protein YxeA
VTIAIISIVIAFAIVVFASLWAWNFEDLEEFNEFKELEGKNDRKKVDRIRRPNKPSKAKTDKKVRSRSK